MRRATWLVILPIALANVYAAPDIAAGKKLFGENCAGCHGAQGEGGRGAPLTSLVRASDDDSLFRIIRYGIPGTEMPRAPVSDDEIRDLVLFVRSIQREVPVAPGSSHGQQIYVSTGCAACHAIEGQGGTLGPDLSRIGMRRRPDYLRRALLEPEADIPDSFSDYRWYTVIPDNFLQVHITTQDGREITGARANEDPFSIQVRDRSGRYHSFWKAELKELRKDWGKSPMPSYREKLSPADIDDLVSYLSSLRGPR